MGECRLNILIAKDFLNDLKDERFVVVFSSDSSIREVAEYGLREGISMIQFIKTNEARLWDCTIYPPKDITSWPIELFTDHAGTKSRTIYEAGWFPSGMIQILPKGENVRTASASIYDDSQYNKRGEEVVSKGRITLSNMNHGSLPSEVLKSAAHRFDDDNECLENDQVQDMRRRRRMEVRQKEEERSRKLQQRIHLLREGSQKNKKVSDQVRHMLIKSRATGRAGLKPEDRIYFHCWIDDGEHETREEFRYFSYQDTMSRIASNFNGDKNQQVEILVERQVDDSKPIYRRLPTLMRVYEAKANGYLEIFNDIIVRIFDPSLEDATISIEAGNAVTLSDQDAVEYGITELPTDKCENLSKELSSDEDIVDDAILFLLLESMNDPKKKTPMSSSAKKVRQMKFKSKAKGDTKRIKVEDRFYIDLFAIKDEKLIETPIFVALSDNFERLIRDCVDIPSDHTKYEFLVPLNEGKFRRITDTSMSMEQAQNEEYLKNFDRLILKFL